MVRQARLKTKSLTGRNHGIECLCDRGRPGARSGCLRRTAQTRLEGFRQALQFYSPLRRVQTERQRVDELGRRIQAAQVHRLEMSKARLTGLENRLGTLSPLAVLGRGYAVVTRAGRVVTSHSQVKAGDDLQVRVQDGEFDAQVKG